MAFERPTLKELSERIQSDLEARLGASGKVLRRSVIAVFARVFAGIAHLLYGYLDWLSNQIFPDTAETEYLDRIASIYNVTRKAASFSQGNLTFSGQVGGVIPAGTVVKRSDGLEYETDIELTLSGLTGTVAITCLTAGATGNAAAGTTLSLVSPIALVSSTATVASGGLTEGADQESDEDLRARVISRIQDPPHGGRKKDYEQWALAISGVTRAWVYPEHLGAGTVGVAFVLDDKVGTIIPSAGEVSEVQDYIDELAPVTADVTVFAPVAVPLNFNITLTPNTAAVKAAVTAELADLLRREAEPGGTIKLSHIREAISVAAGETDHVLNSPSANVTHTTGQIAVMGTITWA